FNLTRSLNEARAADPQDIRPVLQSAGWWLELAELDHKPRDGKEALDLLRNARPLDPLGTELERAEVDIRLRLARGLPGGRKEHLEAAGQLIGPLVEKDRTLAQQLHFRLAEAYFTVAARAEQKEPDFAHSARDAGRQEAERALAANEEVHPRLRLSVRQVAQL